MRQTVDIVCQGITGQSESLDRWLEEDKINRTLETHQEEYPEKDQLSSAISPPLTQ